MSYTPRILINLDSLLSKSQEIMEAYYRETGGVHHDGVDAIKALHEDVEWNQKLIDEKHDFSDSTFKSCGLRITTITTELSSQNLRIRNILDELEIEYALDN